MDHWVEWTTKTYPEDEVPNIDWPIAVFTGGGGGYCGKPEPVIKSWAHPVGALQDLIKKRCNLKEECVFCPYRWPDGLE